MIEIAGPATRRPRDPRPPASEPLGQKAFAERLTAAGIPLELAAWCHRRRFPRGPMSRALDDEARGRLMAEIEAAYTRGEFALGRPGDPPPVHLVPTK